MASNRMPGNLMGLEINGKFVRCELACEFSFETDLRAASPIDSGRWKEYVPGVRSWSIALNASMLFQMIGSGLDTVLNAFMTGEIMDIRFVPKRFDVPHMEIKGKVLVHNGGVSAVSNARAGWNTVLAGNGPFTVTFTNPAVWSQSGDNVVDQSENKAIYVGHG